MGLFQPNRGPAPWPEVHRSCCKGMSVCVRPGLSLVEWKRHSMNCSQIVAAYNARQSGSQVELSHILVSLEFECFLEKMAMTRQEDFIFLGTFHFAFFKLSKCF